MIPDFEILECSEFEVKSKIGKWFMNEKILKNTLLRFIKLILFYEHDKEKLKVDKNGCEYKLFRIDAYFTEYFLAAEIDEQKHEDKELIFEEKIQEALEKGLGCKFIRINTSDPERGYHTD